MILRMNLIMHKELARQDDSGKGKMLSFLLPLDMNLNNQFLFSLMANR